MEWRFTIPGRLPAFNEIINTARHNRYVSAKQMEDWKGYCMAYIKLAKLPRISGPVAIHFKWFEPNNRKDIGNVRVGEKFISDALVMAGVMPNDGKCFVKRMSDEFPPPDKINPRIEVLISQIYKDEYQ